MSTTLASRRPVRAPLVSGATGVLLLTGLVLAGPAAAVEDPSRPVAAVTDGPSCGPGEIRVQVANGNKAHRVALVFDGTTEQDAADLAPDAEVELTSAEVDWGTTVDVSLSVTGADGRPGRPVQFGTYTRPTRADCDAVTSSPRPALQPPTTGATPTPSRDGGTPTPSTAGAGTSTSTGVGTSTSTSVGTTTNTSTSRPTPRRTPATPRPNSPEAPASSSPSSPAGAASTGGRPSAGGPATDGRAAGGPVAPGGVITLRGSGFAPGEPVQVSLPGVGGLLTTVTAAADGSVEAVVQIPRKAGLGPVTVQLVGQASAATSGLDLRIAARQRPIVATGTPAPVLAAGAALLLAGGALGLHAARRPRADADGVPAWER